jgi:hypothetical protein
MEAKSESRKGEKIGWIGGWLGGFIWLLVLSGVWVFQDKLSYAAMGLGLFALALVLIRGLSPWRHPRTKYWKLLLPIYLVFFIAIGLCIYLYGGFEKVGLNRMSFFWIIPCLIPFATIGRRTWSEGV